MEWARLHPYFSALGAAAVLFICGALVVGYRSAQPQSGGLQVWGGAPDAFLNPTSYTPDTGGGLQNSTIGAVSNISFTALPPSRQTDTQGGAGSDFDMSVFIAALSQATAGTGGASASSSADLSLAYSFIPSGLVATTTRGPRRSALQESLYQYGNDAGSYISTYEDAHANAGQVLTDQVKDRQNPQKAQSVRDVGMALQETGKNLQSIDAVPSVALAAHKALAQSYIDAGIQLAKVPGAESDKDFIAAIEAYNTAAAQLAQKYVALANVFAGTGVLFAPQDPGAVFSFSGNAGL